MDENNDNDNDNEKINVNNDEGPSEVIIVKKGVKQQK